MQTEPKTNDIWCVCAIVGRLSSYEAREAIDEENGKQGEKSENERVH